MKIVLHLFDSQKAAQEAFKNDSSCFTSSVQAEVSNLKMYTRGKCYWYSGPDVSKFKGIQFEHVVVYGQSLEIDRVLNSLNLEES